MADVKGSALTPAANLTAAFLLGYNGAGSARFPATLFASAADLAALTTTVGNKADASALATQTGRIDGILASANTGVDTFIEAYNRFITDENAAAALTTTVSGKLTTPASPANGNLLGYVAGAPAWVAPPTGLPTQTGNAGKILTTDATTASWAFALANRCSGKGVDLGRHDCDVADTGCCRTVA